MFTTLFIIRLIVGCLACTLGIPGNIAIIVVFTKQGIKNATDVTFVALAVVDVIACVMNGMKIPIAFFHDEHPWACYIEVIGARSPLYAGLFLTISIAFYRYQAVCKPFDRRFGRRASTLVSICCPIIAFGLHIPFFFITKSMKRRGQYGCNVYGDISWGRDVYAKSQAIIFFVSALVITTLYIRIYKFIRAHQIIRQQMTNRYSSDCQGRPGENIDTKAESVLSVSADISKSDITVSAEGESIGITEMTSSVDIKPAKLKKAFQKATSHKMKRPAKKLQSDHKTTQVVIIITVLFFLLWLPNIVIDQIPNDQITRILLAKDNGSLIFYFTLQVKYISHITNVFVYILAFRRFRQTCCRLF
ncbi:5-hydroxytryptamine receptor 2B-like [Lytechinus variegatus]|uniref:5-hydroxytryptamine receptor 2B-like n=1 Tax=Lytechinus variegatus TaxID=7654 RepID=UPI001BB21E94|nr:5-hydroxytryptamine receptor 2B-like [Lytechinus variegatus]